MLLFSKFDKGLNRYYKTVLSRTTKLFRDEKFPGWSGIPDFRVKCDQMLPYFTRTDKFEILKSLWPIDDIQI